MTDVASTRRDEALVDRAAELMATQFVQAGWPRMAARVYAAILLSPQGALTAAEIVERLSVSPAAVSKAIKFLSQLHLVHRGYEPDSRRDLYFLGRNLSGELIEFHIRWLRSFADTLSEAVDAVGGEQGGAGTRLAEARDFARFAESEMLGLDERWHARQSDD